MTRRIGAYTVVKLARGSYDVLLEGNLIAALIRDIDGPEDEWRIDLLTETPLSECPPPFEAQSYTFSSHQSVLDWLGIHEYPVVRRTIPRSKPGRARPQYRARLSPLERYRLRLLAEHSRFYATTAGLNGLIGRGFISPTGQTDDECRTEWIITDAGRAALAELES